MQVILAATIRAHLYKLTHGPACTRTRAYILSTFSRTSTTIGSEGPPLHYLTAEPFAVVASGYYNNSTQTPTSNACCHPARHPSTRLLFKYLAYPLLVNPTLDKPEEDPRAIGKSKCIYPLHPADVIHRASLEITATKKGSKK